MWVKVGTAHRWRRETEERDAMDWLIDDEMVRQWEEVGKDAEEITLKRSEGGKLQVEKVRSAQELVVAAQMNNMRQAYKAKHRTEEKHSRLVHEDVGGYWEQPGLRGY